MKRWKSPQIAAKHADRAAKKAEENRKEKRKMWINIVVVLCFPFGLIIADYFWLKHQAEQRMEEHRRIFHHKTNSAPVSIDNATNSQLWQIPKPPTKN